MKNVYTKKMRILVSFLAVLVLSVPLFSQQTAIQLGLAGNVVILAKEGVTNTGDSTIRGHVGLSPAGSAQITGFGPGGDNTLTLSGDGTYATSPIVVEGKVFVSDMNAPTPALLAQAVSDMEDAYAYGLALETGVGDYSYTGDENQVLTQTLLNTYGAGLYKWDFTGEEVLGVNITANIVISGEADDVWIFVIDGQLNLSQDVEVTLDGSAQAKNIFWVLNSGATLQQDSHISGTMLTLATIAFHTSASMEGKALSNTFVTLLENNTLIYDGDIPDTLPVTLSSFTAGVTAGGMVTLQWTSETETNMLGYNVYRAEENKLADASAINRAVIPASNKSTTTHYNFTDENVIPGSTYYYWLQSMDLDLTNKFYGPISIQVNEDGEDGTIKPSELTTRLIGAYPNPFNPGTYINFSLAENDKVTITIYNNRGQLIKTLIAEQSFDKGINHSVYWDGKDSRGNDVGSGVYLYIMETNDNYSSQKKMILVK